MKALLMVNKMIGIDIISVKRFRNRKETFLKKVFSPKELSETKFSIQSLAGKWAAKEAAFKAGLEYVNHDIEIITENNKPYIYINGIKNQAMVSISHDEKYATAIVFNF